MLAAPESQPVTETTRGIRRYDFSWIRCVRFRALTPVSPTITIMVNILPELAETETGVFSGVTNGPYA